MTKLVFLLAVALSLAACNNYVAAQKKHIAVEGIDPAKKPGDNFFLYINNKWYDTARIPPSQSGVGAYMFMNYPQRLRLQGILDSVSKATNTTGSIEQQLGDFYASGMDTLTIDKRGYDPIKPMLRAIDSIADVAGLVRFAASGLKAGNGSILSFSVGPDNKNSHLNIAHLYQTGIGMPDRDYYFKTDSPTVAIQAAYKKYLAALFTLTGSNAATALSNATLVYGIEKQLAATHKTNIELRDINANYNKMPVAVLAKKHPNMGWLNVLTILGVTTDSIDVAQTAYYDQLNALLPGIPLSDWKLYLKASTLNVYTGELSKPFGDAAFEYTKVLKGQAVQKARGEQIAEAVDQLLGEALGQLYVKKYFTENARKRALELVNNLQQAFAARINHLDWMSDSTKQKAKEKLFAITKKIGYPDKWRTYKQVHIERSSYFENVVSAASNDYRHQLEKLGKPVDRSEWFTTPSTVTAYYNPAANEIVFPAAILQSPYFDEAADDALNYGGIGMVIGHEMTHAFDDQGAQFDKDGNVSNWWTKGDYARFKAKTQQVVDLYSTFTVLDTLHVKGALTLGENTADVGGVSIAYDAFKLTPQGHGTTRIDGFTPDQRFCISIARIWRVKMKDAFLRYWINNNPHSPPMWRVNGPLMNMPYFHQAFNIQPGDKMYVAEKDRIKIW
ncbi:M13 family metallopeptidase [Ferruginibacter paludis]|uniref:M13 family metallopeptidase n=1 Tax=Ferruginibacter paludis TaxID=1310417 RepID=UPI0025B2913A|nr:M13 family metallopeptidase [Ferruginibacter paludis]MDN3658662.1 M13 family metallopeptidase [Ferruginibacter paludis]